MGPVKRELLLPSPSCPSPAQVLPWPCGMGGVQVWTGGMDRDVSGMGAKPKKGHALASVMPGGKSPLLA